MPALVNVETVRSRYRLGADSSITDSITEALKAATVHLTSLLRTRFDRATLEDLYWLDSEEEPFVGNFPQFYLSRGFLTPAEVTVTYAVTKKLLSTDPVAVEAVDININRAAGVVDIVTPPENPNLLLLPTLDKVFVKVEYTAGFEATDQGGLAVFSGVPDWLQEAAILMAFGIYHGEAACFDPEAGKTNPYTFSAYRMVERYIRYYPAALKPVTYGTTS